MRFLKMSRQKTPAYFKPNANSSLEIRSLALSAFKTRQMHYSCLGRIKRRKNNV